VCLLFGRSRSSNTWFNFSTNSISRFESGSCTIASHSSLQRSSCLLLVIISIFLSYGAKGSALGMPKRKIKQIGGGKRRGRKNCVAEISSGISAET
jgi:hypothetical protein